MWEPAIGKHISYEQFTMLAFRVVSCLMGSAAIVLTYARGGIRWRGTFYSLRELRNAGAGAARQGPPGTG